MKANVLFLAALLISATTANAEEFPAGTGRDIVASACTQCHDAGVVTSQRKTRAEWESTVSQMIANGANVKESSFEQAVDYLARNFPAVGTGTTGTLRPNPVVTKPRVEVARVAPKPSAKKIRPRAKKTSSQSVR